MNADGEVAPGSDLEEAKQRPCDDSVRRPGGDASDREEAKQRLCDDSEREEVRRRRQRSRGGQAATLSDARDAGNDRPSTVCDGPPWVPGRRRHDVCAHARERTRHVYTMTM